MYPKSITIPHVHYESLNFLTSSIASKISPADFNEETGKPLSNLIANTKVDAFFLNSLTQNLYERSNVNDKFIYNFPQVLEVDAVRDLVITDETTIDAVFIYEGASMRNMFGYYFYYTDESGTNHILDNDGTNNANEDYYYHPTVIFPNVTCELGDHTTLQPGNTRRLRGNLPNGNFQNVSIGFFLICYGWYAHITNTTINDDKILYSTIDFNTKYRDSSYKMVNDLIYSVFFKGKSESGDELLMVAFEDVFHRGVDDLDYNDCVIGLQASDVRNIKDYDKFATIDILDATKPEYNNVIFLSDDGEYVCFPDSRFNIDTKYDHKFERHMVFNNSYDRDTMFNVINNMKLNYKVSVTKVTSGSQYKIVITHLFRKNDLVFSRKDNKKQLYLTDIKFNKDDDDDKGRTNNYSNLLQKALMDSSYYELYRLYESLKRSDGNRTPAEVILLTDLIDTPKRDTIFNFRILGGGLLDCKNGKVDFPSNTAAIYKVYKNMDRNNNGLAINIKMDTHPTGYKAGTKTFFRYISFISGNKHVVVDLKDLSLYKDQSNNGTLTPITDMDMEILSSTFQFSSVQTNPGLIKELISILRNDSGALFRTITINNAYKFYCVRMPNVKNNPTLVFMDTNSVTNWGELTNITGGTYYNKQRFYVTNGFTSI